MLKVNEEVVVEQLNDHYCLVRQSDKKVIEMCFYSMVDALAYAVERKYL